MAYEIPLYKIGIIPADADFSNENTYQYTGMVIGAATGSSSTEGAAVKAVGGAGVQIAGILQNNPIAGEPAVLTALGVSKAQAGAAVATIGAILKVDATGKLVPATTGTFGVAMALTAAATGDTFTVLVMPFGVQP